MLAVRESWLRRRATARAVPCTFLGKHLRFSHADLVAIAQAGATAAGPPPHVRVRRPAAASTARRDTSSRADTLARSTSRRPLPLYRDRSVHIPAAPPVISTDRRTAHSHGVGRTERQPHLAGPVPPRGQHHRRDQRVPDQGRGHRPRQHPGIRSTPGQLHRPGRREDHPGGLVTGLAGRPGCGDPDRGLLPQPAAPPRPAPLGRTRPGRHLRDQSRRLGQATAGQGLLAGHGGQRDEAAVAAAVRRGRRTPHPGQPDPGAAPRPATQRPPGRTPVGHPRRGARGRRQRRPAAHRRGRRRRC